MANVKKVLLLVENQPAPADRRVWPEAIALRDHGFQVNIISPSAITEDGAEIGIHRYVGNEYRSLQRRNEVLWRKTSS
jgi:hypothetical protein